MGRDLLLGLDVGTSSVKAGLFAPEGRLAALTRVPYRTEMPHPGWAETPPERWWRAAARAIRGLGGVGDRVAAVGLSVLFPALTAMDEQGKALRPAILYCDQRSAKEAADLGGDRRQIERLTGNRMLPGTCSLSSLLWLRHHESGVYRRAHVFGHACTFLAHRLTGRLAVDRTSAGLSGMMAMGREDAFSARLCGLAGVELGRLPTVLRCSDVVGGVTRAAARTTGLRTGTPVVIGTGDAAAAAFGAGLAGPDRALCVLGSSDNVVTASRTPALDPHACNMAHCVDGCWVSIATATSTGTSVDWFAREFLSRHATGRDVVRLAAKSPPGARGVVFLPYLQGERTPVWDPGARGVFYGLTASTTREDMARAVLEGCAFAFRQVVQTRPGRPKLLVVGGVAQSRPQVQMRASVVGRPLHVMAFQETAALGAAMLAGLGAGVYRSPRAAIAATDALRETRPIRPEGAERRVYEERFRTYEGLYPALKALPG